MSEWCTSIKLDKVKQQTTPIDVPFANAGIIGLTPLGSVTEDYFDKIFSVNVNGILFTVQKALTLFQDGGGSIIQVFRPEDPKRSKEIAFTVRPMLLCGRLHVPETSI